MRKAILLAFVLLCLPVLGDEKLLGIACRSVHLQYPSGSTRAVYNTVTVKRSAPGTYFCVLGFNRGYFGIQELGNGKKLLIFSVWDPGNQNNPNIVDEARRVQMLYKDPAVRTGRFGNEGTGGQSFFDYDWQNDTPYHFMVTSKVDGERTIFSGHFFHPERKQWMKLITFSTPTGGREMGGFYSFVEDFRRNRVSATEARVAEFGLAWVFEENQWRQIDRARFTADSNPAMNINAGVTKDQRRFFLATGGETENTGAKLRELIEIAGVDEERRPEILPERPPVE